LYAIKGRPILSNRLPDVLRGNEFLNSEHPTKKPIDLIMSIIESLTMEGDIIVDPFMGSGSTGVGAVRTNRVFYGCDKERKWWEDSISNIQKEIVYG
jgi:DNA modification methylase